MNKLTSSKYHFLRYSKSVYAFTGNWKIRKKRKNGQRYPYSFDVWGIHFLTLQRKRKTKLKKRESNPFIRQFFGTEKDFLKIVFGQQNVTSSNQDFIPPKTITSAMHFPWIIQSISINSQHLVWTNAPRSCIPFHIFTWPVYNHWFLLKPWQHSLWHNIYIP